MDSVIERINKGHYWKFHGGIHPPEQKFLTCNKPIRSLTIPKELTIPLQQHIGQAGELLVKVGDKVLKGQALTSSYHPMAVPIHAPTSGTISGINNATIAHPSGYSEPCVFLSPDGEDKWREREICNNYRTLAHDEIISKISNAGIAGMGGAGFPTNIKINTNAKINFLIINAAECEPYITADDLLIKEHSSSIIDGINILDQLLNPTHILIGIEDNKPDAIQAIKRASSQNGKIKVCVIPTKYPSGGEKQLIKILTGQEVTSGQLPSHHGIVMQNIATCFAIADAVINDIPLIKRVVTVSGQALKKPQNVWALLGTPVSYLLSQCGYQQPRKQHIIMGGPMMGFSLSNDLVPIVKSTNCILAPSEAEISADDNEVECIRCGQCADACPAQLQPQELQWSAKAKDYDQLNVLNLFDCIECGACAYVCPSQIPLVHYYRIAKAEIREKQQQDIKAERAKIRFEARKTRLEKEKLAREEKHRKAAEARKARMNAGTPEANAEQSAVAAALARVKAKKNPVSSEQTPATGDSKTGNNVAAAIARAKAKKLAKQAEQENNAITPSETIDDSSNDKKSKVSAAIAKAKAKKLAAKQAQESSQVSEQETPYNKSDAKAAETSAPIDSEAQVEKDAPAVNDNKAKVAAAIAKAKAKKLAAKQAQESSQVSEEEPNNKSDVEAAETSTSIVTETPDEKDAPAVNDKKAKVAAAIAKAKAKKLAAQESSQDTAQEHADINEPTTSENKSSPADDKKARIALAIAKAKAKKQQSEST